MIFFLQIFSQLASLRFGSRFVIPALCGMWRLVCIDLQLSPQSDVADGDHAAGNKLRR